MRFKEGRGAAAVEAGLLLAGVAALLVGVLALAGRGLEGFIGAVVTAISGS